MNLEERIREDLKISMKAKNKDRVSLLRVIIGNIQTETSKEGVIMNDDYVISILTSIRKGTVEMCNELETSIIDEYLPTKMTTEKLTELIEMLIKNNNFSAMSDMGKVMSLLKNTFGGQYDGSEASKIVKEKLS